MTLHQIWKIMPYFIVKKLASKYSERMPYKGRIIEVFDKEGITIEEEPEEDKCSICGAPLKGFIYYEKNGFKICRFCYKDLQMKEG